MLVIEAGRPHLHKKTEWGAGVSDEGDDLKDQAGLLMTDSTRKKIKKQFNNVGKR